MWRRTRFERVIGAGDTFELAAHGWKRSQRVVGQEMIVHVQ